MKNKCSALRDHHKSIAKLRRIGVFPYALRRRAEATMRALNYDFRALYRRYPDCDFLTRALLDRRAIYKVKDALSLRTAPFALRACVRLRRCTEAAQRGMKSEYQSVISSNKGPPLQAAAIITPSANFGAV
jgi:hypothetical protein